ncbi:MAG: hypothetical protein ACJA0F_001082 [Dinoroseobacter sp.]
MERRQYAAAKVTADRNFNELEGFCSGAAEARSLDIFWC